MEHVLEKVSAALKETCRVEKNGKILVAVSGGPDSVFLLEALIRLTAESDCDLRLSAAHLDHGLREVESRQDCEFVADLCGKWNVPLAVEAADVRGQRRPGESLEQAARNVRYRFLENAAGTTRAQWIATGHTADDQAETLLLRIARGTGIEGLRGIIPKRSVSGNSPVVLVRPLLDVTRAEITGYLQSHRIPWRTDRSNLDTRFARNRIRASLAAMPKEDARRLRNLLCTMASCAVRDWAHIEQAVAEILDSAVDKTDFGIEIDLAALDLSRKELVPYVVREMIRKSAGSLRGIKEVHVHRLQNLIDGDRTVGRLDLPGGMTVIREYDTLRIGRFPEEAREIIEVSLPVPGRTVLPDGTVLEAEPVNGQCLSQARRSADDPMVEYVDRKKIASPLTVRYRRQGDRFRPLGTQGEKKLKDFLIDTKAPRSMRDSIPIVTSGDEIVWVAGCRLDDRYKLDNSTTTAVRLTCLGRKGTVQKGVTHEYNRDRQ